ncbi:MAG: hypothetical protein QXI97_02415 [Nitrososphaerota archaeon]
MSHVDPSRQTEKRRRLVLRGYVDLEDFRKIINDDKLDTLMKLLEKINPKEDSRTSSGETIEI